MIGWHTFKPTCSNTAYIVTDIKNQFTFVSATNMKLLDFPKPGDIHVLLVRIVRLLALTIDCISNAGKWSG